jgi:general stress protein 26
MHEQEFCSFSGGLDADMTDRGAALRSLLRGLSTAVLTTVTVDGMFRGRPLLLLEIDAAGTLWFFTTASSQKVTDIERDPRVSVSLANSGRTRFVSLSGSARISRDTEKIRSLWKPLYRAWLPGGREDPELVLLSVVVRNARYWLVPSNALVRALRMLVALLSRRPYEEGEKGEFTFPAQ